MTHLFKDFTVSIKGNDEDKRIITFLVSTGDIDRDMEIIDPKGWKLKNYKKNPVFLWAHDHRGLPVARGVKFADADDGLLIDYKFATEDEYPFADTVYKLYKGGFLNAVSVGFLPLKWEDADPTKSKYRRRYIEQELLEVSAVAVPSNYNAVVQARDAGCIGEDEFVKVKSFFNEPDEAYQKQGDPPAHKHLDGTVPYRAETKAEAVNGWDAEAAVKRIATWAGGDELNLEKYQRGFAWVNANDKDSVDAYLLPHHDIADGSIITPFKGVAAAMAALLGASGEVHIPDADRQGVYDHLKQHYAQFDKEPPELRLFEQEAIKALFEDVGDDASRQVIQEPPAKKAMDASNGKANDGDIIDQILNGLKEEKNRDAISENTILDGLVNAARLIKGETQHG